MLAIATGQEIDFPSVKAEPFSNIIHFKVLGRIRSMRVTDWGQTSIVATDRPTPIPVVNVFAKAPQRAGGYGKSWVGRADMNTEEFVRNILDSLR